MALGKIITGDWGKGINSELGNVFDEPKPLFDFQKDKTVFKASWDGGFGVSDAKVRMAVEMIRLKFGVDVGYSFNNPGGYTEFFNGRDGRYLRVTNTWIAAAASNQIYDKLVAELLNEMKIGYEGKKVETKPLEAWANEWIRRLEREQRTQLPRQEEVSHMEISDFI